MGFSLSKIDLLVLTGGSLIILLLGGGLYGVRNFRSSEASGESLGTITYRHRIAERKYSDTVVWEAVQQNAPVYNMDWIRTDDRSEATVHLEEGTKINLDQESMIVLDMEENRPGIELLRGSIQVQRDQDGFLSPDVRVRAGNTDLEFGSGSARLSLSGDQARLDSAEGIVTYTFEGKQLSLEPGQVALLQEGKHRSLNLDTILDRPGDGDHYFTAKERMEIEFRWDSKNAGDAPYTVEVAGDRNFEYIRVRTTTENTSATLSIPRGIYYWRVLGRSPSDHFSVHKISIFEKRAPLPVSPKDNDRFRYVVDPPMVRFHWQPLQGASSYILRVWKDDPDSTPLEVRTVQSERISLPFRNGTYYWQVEPLGKYETAFEKGPIRSFDIILSAELAPPSVGYPSRNEILDLKTLNEDGITFNWEMDSELRTALLQVSKDSSFKSPIIERSAPGRYATLRMNVKEGQYYWRVLGMDRRGKKTEYSKTGIFRVENSDQGEPEKARETGDQGSSPTVQEQSEPSAKQEEQSQASERIKESQTADPGEQKDRTGEDQPEKPAGPVTLKSPTLKSPGQGSTVDMSTKDSITFRWSPVAGASEYSFKLLRGGKEVFSTRVSSTSYTLTDLSVLDVGTFSWSVSALPSGQDLASPEARGSFQITLQDTPGMPTGIETEGK